jgi:hypothetical protein
MQRCQRHWVLGSSCGALASPFGDSWGMLGVSFALRSCILATSKILDLCHGGDLGSWTRPRSNTRKITNNSKHKSKTMYGQWGMGPPLREHEVVPTLREVVGLARGIFTHDQDLGPWILDLGSWPRPRSEIVDLGRGQDIGSWPRPRSCILAMSKILDLCHGKDLGSWTQPRSNTHGTSQTIANTKAKQCTASGVWGPHFSN